MRKQIYSVRQTYKIGEREYPGEHGSSFYFGSAGSAFIWGDERFASFKVIGGCFCLLYQKQLRAFWDNRPIPLNRRRHFRRVLIASAIRRIEDWKQEQWKSLAKTRAKYFPPPEQWGRQ